LFGCSHSGLEFPRQVGDSRHLGEKTYRIPSGRAMKGTMNGQRKALLLALSVSLLMLFPVSARSGAPNRVALVVRFGDGSAQTKCVEFNEAQITGLEALTRSGLSVIYQASGSSATVCKIRNDGCNYPSQPCFCQCSGGANCVYWSYWHLKSGAWQYSQLGASSYMVGNGNVEGWVWGPGSPNSAPQPPMVDFNSVCAPLATATFTPSPLPPTATPTRAPTNTPRPTSTPVPAVAVSFSAQAGQITAGECSTLQWTVDNAQAVFLDGQGVSGHASQQVCPRQTQTYELRVVSASGETRRSVTVTVLQPSASPIVNAPSPTLTSAALPKPTQSPAPVALLQATTRPAPTLSVTMAPVTASPLPPTATPIPTVAASPPQKVAVVQPEKKPVQPTEPETDEADAGFPLELLGWAAIVGALLATLALVNVLKRQRNSF